MIGYLEGKILQKYNDRILLLVNQIGFEILLPAYLMDRFQKKTDDEIVSLYIYYQQTERQPKPLLIGFDQEMEKEFFQLFISVSDIGPLKAVKAMTIPIGDIANAIECRDEKTLKQLKGIGIRSAQKIIATLGGKMSRFIQVSSSTKTEPDVQIDLHHQVIHVLTDQLGYRQAEARQMVTQAMERNQKVSSPEALLDEIFNKGTA